MSEARADWVFGSSFGPLALAKGLALQYNPKV
jgi:hypothetical protein